VYKKHDALKNGTINLGLYRATVDAVELSQVEQMPTRTLKRSKLQVFHQRWEMSTEWINWRQ